MCTRSVTVLCYSVTISREEAGDLVGYFIKSRESTLHVILGNVHHEHE